MSWRDYYRKISDKKKHIEKYSGVMTGYERAVAGDELHRMIETNYGYITGSMAAEYISSAEKIQRQWRVLERAQQAEARSWDIARLVSAHQLMEIKIKQISDLPEKDVMGALPSRSKAYTEFVKDITTTGDKYQIRALIERLDAQHGQKLKITGGFVPEADAMIRQAKAKLASERETNEIRDITVSIQDSVTEHNKIRRDIVSALVDMGMPNPLDPMSADFMSRTIKRVVWDGMKPTILDENDERVTNVFIRTKETVRTGE